MKRMVLLSTVLTVAVTAVLTAPAGAAVVSPQARPFGSSYGQWGARWWQWLLQTPVTGNPEFSPAGTPTEPASVDCTDGQSGRVWFIGGTFLPTSTAPPASRSDVYRTCTIPRATYLFFPILNDEWDNLTNGCQTTDYSGEQLTAAAATPIDDIVTGSMAATIDGVSVNGLEDGNSSYRAPSPWFSYTLPADNIGQFFGCDPPVFSEGTTPPLVDGHPGVTADGVYLMLAPLSPGTHRIHFGGELNVPAEPPPAPPLVPVDFIQNINYTITVR